MITMDSKLDKFANGCLLLVPFFVIGLHRAVTIVLLASFVIWLWWGRKKTYEISNFQRWFFYSGALVFLVALAMLVWADFPEKGHRELEKYLRLMLCYPFIVMLTLARTKAHFFWIGIAVAGVVTGIVAVVDEFVLGKVRANGLGTLNPIFYGNYSILFSFLSLLGAFWFRGQNDNRYFYLGIIGAAGGFVALVLSSSRGGAIAIPIYGILCLAFFIANKNYRAVAACVLMAVAITASLVFASSMMRDRFLVISDEINAYIVEGNEKSSVGLRLYMWETAWHAFVEKPIIGHSTGKFSGLPYKSTLRDSYPEENNPHGHAHNEYLQTMATRGLLGLAPLLLLLFLPLLLGLRFVRKKNIFYGFSLIGVSLGFAIYGLTDMIFMKSTGADTYVYLVSALMVLGGKSLSEHVCENGEKAA